jgi:hypothetical protein
MHLHARVSYEVLESLLLAGLQARLGDAHGLSVDEVALRLTEEDDRSAGFRVEVCVSKLAGLVHATVVVRGRFTIRDRFVARVWGLTAGSDGLHGLVGRIAGLFVDVGERIRDGLRPWQGRTFPLATLFPGRELQDVRLRCHPRELEIIARFAG